MSKQLLLPELAESVVEGEILKWLIQEGERVELEQPICEVMTDKVTVELPSPYAGILEKHLAPEGAVVAVHAAIALISEEAQAPDAAPPSAAGEGETAPVTLPTAPAEEEADTSLFKVVEHQETLKVSGLRASQPATLVAPPALAPQERETRTMAGRVLAVPAARQLARELGLDIAHVSGSGPNGRVRPLDVHQHAEKQNGGQQLARPTGPDASPETPVAPATPPASTPPGAGLNVPPVQYRTPKGYEHLETRVPLRGMRRAIAGQMQASHLYTVRTLTVDEANLSALVELRGRLNADLAATGQKLSYMPFIFKAVVAALKKYPSLNTSLDELTAEVVQKGYYHLGMAVTTDVGLTVPVIRDADQRSILELGQRVNELAEKARSNKLKPEELAGSSFSVTNIGSVGALFSFPIINVPDAAILGVHSIVKRPIVDKTGQIVAADMMYLSLSFDHRLVDGAEAARFCKEVIRLLENPEMLLVSV
ncbi:dihydrolipoamide acetyltransferase family protein [Deinococcus radiomollis]|uniref:dihydrolipoamide acetyltransferase family protein n=1 Tax=Deinococcus radiomollis TaxID=468916 RepID=UPI0038919DA1